MKAFVTFNGTATIDYAWDDYGYRYYSAELGRWPNRDPIGENGGLNLFVFSLNAPISRYDALGQDSSKVSPGGLQCCNDSSLRNAGEKELNDKYLQIVSDMKKDGYRPKGRGAQSCNNVSDEVQLRLLDKGVPECWGCARVVRVKKAPVFGYVTRDHSVLICRAYDKSGALVKEIIFDFWDLGETPGGDPSDFYKKYPHPDPRDSAEPDISLPNPCEKERRLLIE